jgi:hypothetical protein
MITELSYREVRTDGMPHTTVQAGDWSLTITRCLGMTEILTDDGFSTLDPVYVKGHPPEAEIAEWWVNDWEKRPSSFTDMDGDCVSPWKIRWWIRWAKVKHLLGW